MLITQAIECSEISNGSGFGKQATLPIQLRVDTCLLDAALTSPLAELLSVGRVPSQTFDAISASAICIATYELGGFKKALWVVFGRSN